MSVRGHAASRPRVRITARAVLVLMMLIVAGIAFVYPLRLYIAQQGKIDDLERQTQALAGENRELQREVDKLHDPAYLERLARECLGMVGKGETSFVLVPRGGESSPEPC
ncbi:MAG: septum formation initiator family protein [Actinomycetota bacterium]